MNPSEPLPISLIVDDPCPGYNPLHFHLPDEKHLREIPLKLIHDCADLFEEFGVRGKFSLLPYPMGMGPIDGHVKGIPDEVVKDFVAVVRDRIGKQFDITPEILTHAQAVDLTNPGKLLEEREDAYFAHIDAKTMTEYISLALQILRNVGIDATGVTSPWSLGKEREDDYMHAIFESQKRVNGRSKTWYFLHVDWNSQSEKPLHKVMHWGKNGQEWVVSIVSNYGKDFIWCTQYGQEPETDGLITSNGKSGRLAQLVKAGCPIVFHTHWQSIFSNGSFRGLAGLRELFQRIQKNLGERVRWTKCSDLAAMVAGAYKNS